MSIIARLQNCGLTITWTVLRLAWNARSNGPTLIPTLPREELLAYAMDQIGSGPPEQDESVAELAFADERDTYTIQRCLDGLASDGSEDVGHAVRVWRWALLDELITELQEETDDVPDVGVPTWGVWIDDFRTGMWCALSDFWAEFEPMSHDLDGLRSRIGADLIGELDAELSCIRTTLKAYREWLSEEKARLLRAQVGPSHGSKQTSQNCW